MLGFLGAAAVSGLESELPMRVSIGMIVAGTFGLSLQFAEPYKRIVLTEDRLSVGKDSFALTDLVAPVITGAEAAELAGAIAGNPLSSKESAELRLLGGGNATTLGQEPVLVRHKTTRKLLVIGSWQPDKFAAALERSIALDESKDQEA